MRCLLLWGFLAAPSTAWAVAEVDSLGTSHPFQLERRLVVSPDGAHAYVADYHSIRVFERTAANGRLLEIQKLIDGEGGVDGLRAAEQMAISPDGAHVYVAAPGDDAVAIFSRDAGTGELTFVTAVFDDVGGVDGLRRVEFVIVSPTGEHVYAFGLGDGLIAVFGRDATSGLLSFVEAEPYASTVPTGAARGRTASMSHDGSTMYVVLREENLVKVFARDGATGALSFVQELASLFTFRDPLAVDVSADDNQVYVATTSNATMVFDRDGFTGALTHSQTAGSGGRDVQVSPDGAHVYVAGGTEIAIFERDAGTGLLSLLAAATDATIRGLEFPLALAFSPDGVHLYETSPGYSGIHVLARDAGTGGLSLAGIYDRRVPHVVALSPDDSHLYASTGSPVEALELFDIDLSTGGLASAGALLFEGVDGAIGLPFSGMALSPGGEHLYGAGPAGVAVLERNALDGSVTPVEVDGAVTSAKEVLPTADGAHVYVRVSGGLAAFDRDSVSGELTFLELHTDGVAGVDGLQGTSDPVLSPSGAHLYVPGSFDDAVAVFERDSATGALTFVGAQDGGHALDNAISAVLSPGGLQLYLSTDDGMVVMTRDPVTGALTHLESENSGKNGNGLFRSFALALSPDGSLLYAVGNDLVLFRRDLASGRLSWIERDELSVTGGPTSLDMTRDGDLTFSGIGLWGPMRSWRLGFPGCSTTPLAGCRTGLKSTLLIKENALDFKDRFSWKLVNAAPTILAEFDPESDTQFIACLYDESGVATPLVMEALAPSSGDCRSENASQPKPCWKVGAKSSQYSDKYLTPEGLRKVLLKPSDTQKTKIKLEGRGEDAPMPALPLGLPVRMQLQSSSGLCWEAHFPAAIKNDATQFKAKLG